MSFEIGEDGQLLLSRQSEIFSINSVYSGGSAEAAGKENLTASDNDSDMDSGDSWPERSRGPLLVFTLKVTLLSSLLPACCVLPLPR